MCLRNLFFQNEVLPWISDKHMKLLINEEGFTFFLIYKKRLYGRLADRYDDRDFSIMLWDDYEKKMTRLQLCSWSMTFSISHEHLMPWIEIKEASNCKLSIFLHHLIILFFQKIWQTNNKSKKKYMKDYKLELIKSSKAWCYFTILLF